MSVAFLSLHSAVFVLSVVFIFIKFHPFCCSILSLLKENYTQNWYGSCHALIFKKICKKMNTSLWGCPIKTLPKGFWADIYTLVVFYCVCAIYSMFLPYKYIFIKQKKLNYVLGLNFNLLITNSLSSRRESFLVSNTCRRFYN